MSGYWMPIAAGAFLTIGFVFYFYYTNKAKETLQQTIRAAIDKGSELSPELITKLAEPLNEKKNVKKADLRKAIILAVVAMGVAAFIRSLNTDQEVISIAFLPAFLSLGYFIMWKFTHNDD